LSICTDKNSFQSAVYIRNPAKRAQLNATAFDAGEKVRTDRLSSRFPMLLLTQQIGESKVTKLGKAWGNQKSDIQFAIGAP
jgi:hypothetical protein